MRISHTLYQAKTGSNRTSDFTSNMCTFYMFWTIFCLSLQKKIDRIVCLIFIVLFVIFIYSLCNFLQTVHQIQMGLRYGINAYKSVQDAWLGAMTSERKEEPKIMLVAIAEASIMNEMVTLFTKGHECLDMKLRCRENLSLSVEPSYLYLYKPLKDDEVGDLAVIKYSPSANEQKQVCEGLILSKFQMSFCFSTIWYY